MEKKKNELIGKKYKKKQESFFLENIIKYKKDVSIKSKYRLILDKHEYRLTYEDDKILEFLEQLAENKRPTLLTADEILADRAKCYGFEYILIVNLSIEKSTNKDNTKNNPKPTAIAKSKEKEDPIKDKVDILGVKITLQKEKIIIQKNKSSLKVFFVQEKEIEEIAKITQKNIEGFDYIVILEKSQKHREVKVVKVTIVEGKINKEVFGCKFINEIYKIKLSEPILDVAKTLLTN